MALRIARQWTDNDAAGLHVRPASILLCIIVSAGFPGTLLAQSFSAADGCLTTADASPLDPFSCISIHVREEGPVIAGDGEDRLVVAWLSKAGVAFDADITIRYRVIELGSTPRASFPRRLHEPVFEPKPFRFNRHNVHPSVAMIGSGPLKGHWIAVWEERFVDREFQGTQIRVYRIRVLLRQFHPTGTPIGPARVVDERANFEFMNGLQCNPVCAVDSNGNHVVIWQPLDRSATDARLVGILYAWDGSVLHPRFSVDDGVPDAPCTGTDGAQRPSVSMTPDGEFFGVSWRRQTCSSETIRRDGLRIFRITPGDPARLMRSQAPPDNDYRTTTNSSVLVTAHESLPPVAMARARREGLMPMRANGL
ncbi:MAG: hypothetical protein HUU22_09690 [Phycisphaerae bacterium]|nr:hypothetical protein [Phycisphaerae bacterium]NUQ46294.1 hypothetical protein [Phycisphaerae bacterium]